MDEAAPELARALRAVFRVSRVARTKEQRATASAVTARWVVLAIEAGWTQQQIADAVDVHPSAVQRRAQRLRASGEPVPERTGVLAVPAAPLSEATQARLRRQRLIGPAEVAQLVGCQPPSVKLWAESRGVPFEWTPGHAKRLYDRQAVLVAAARQPTEKHHRWRRRKNVAIPPHLRVGIGAPVTRPYTAH